MKAKVVRYLPQGNRQLGDRITRLFIPSRRLIISPDMIVRRGTISGGEILAEIKLDAEFVNRAERIVQDQDLLAANLRRNHKSAWEMLKL